MLLIKHGYVPENVLDYVKTLSIQCVHGDKSEYPTAEVTMNVNEQMYLMCVEVCWCHYTVYRLLNNSDQQYYIRRVIH